MYNWVQSDVMLNKNKLWFEKCMAFDNCKCVGYSLVYLIYYKSSESNCCFRPSELFDSHVYIIVRTNYIF
jgi:hypothetical protein